MRTLVVLILLATCVAFSSALSVQNATQFLLGFGEGVEVDFTGKNVTQCVEDEQADFEDFETGFSDLDQGIKKKSLSLIKSGIVSFGAGVNEIGQVMQACDLGVISQDIIAIAQQIESGDAFQVIMKELVSIFHDKTELTAEFQAAIAAWQSGDYFTSGENVGEIAGVLLQD